jgi:hypothetical protein
MKAREIPSVHLRLYRISDPPFRGAVQILSCFADEEFEIVVQARRCSFLEHGADLFTPFFWVFGQARAILQG